MTVATLGTRLAAAGIAPAPVLDLSEHPASLWLVYASRSDRDAAERLMWNSWVTLEDRSVKLDCCETRRSAAGWVLHLTSSAFLSIRDEVAARRYKR